MGRTGGRPDRTLEGRLGACDPGPCRTPHAGAPDEGDVDVDPGRVLRSLTPHERQAEGTQRPAHDDELRVAVLPRHVDGGGGRSSSSTPRARLRRRFGGGESRRGTGLKLFRAGDHLDGHERLERATGIEPACPAWEAGALPLSYARDAVRLAHTLAHPRAGPRHRPSPSSAGLAGGARQSSQCLSTSAATTSKRSFASLPARRRTLSGSTRRMRSVRTSESRCWESQSPEPMLHHQRPSRCS